MNSDKRKKPYSNHFRDIKQKNTLRMNTPLTTHDAELLDILRTRYLELGRTPTQGDIEDRYRKSIKQRFGLWKSAIEAAGLPALNDPAQTRLRQTKLTEVKSVVDVS